jgi:hypothetical protein
MQFFNYTPRLNKNQNYMCFITLHILVVKIFYKFKLKNFVILKLSIKKATGEENFSK